MRLDLEKCLAKINVNGFEESFSKTKFQLPKIDYQCMSYV